MIGEQLAMRIKAVLFDLGGTLVDTPSDFDYENLLVPLHQSLVKNGVVVPFDEYRKVHVGIRDRIWSEDSLKEVAFASIICEALGRLGYSFQFTDKLILDATEAFMEPWIQARTMEEDVPSVLGRLKERFKVGVVSNFSCSSAVWKTLERFGVLTFFDVVVVSVDVGWRKPSSRIFQAALRELGVSASETVFVGDELDHDVEGAKKVGMYAVWLRRPSSIETVGRIKADGTIGKLEELFSVLRRFELA